MDVELRYVELTAVSAIDLVWGLYGFSTFPGPVSQVWVEEFIATTLDGRPGGCRCKSRLHYHNFLRPTIVDLQMSGTTPQDSGMLHTDIFRVPRPARVSFRDATEERLTGEPAKLGLLKEWVQEFDAFLRRQLEARYAF